ncbi:urea transporter [Macrococcus equipercicus]|uniref:Urea transporter n=1 Tax=Macrococcus equipercicus TaxID=69967 RepID=A0ABQ6RAQ4_9STAP|nr:urea transporter [Macrococcus equipercicus]KAA1042320.1 urea transporter [Macrococcus equipercicus]
MKIIDTLLKNISQVLLIENKWTGLLILLALTIADWRVGIAALAASAISFYTAPLLAFTEEEISHGLAGFNPVLTTIALTVFLHFHWINLLIIISSIPVTMLIHKALQMLLDRFGLSVYTMPFILTTWLFINTAYSTKFVDTTLTLLPETMKHPEIAGGHFQLLQALLESFTEVFLVSNIISGIIMIIAIWIADRKLLLVTLIGTLLGILLIFGLDVSTSQLNNGLFGYNLVLSLIVIWMLFKQSRYSIAYMAFGVIVTVIMNLSLVTPIAVFGLPILTAPFVITAWIFQLYAEALSRRAAN